MLHFSLMMDSVPHIPEGLERVGDKASDILLPTKDGERYTLADAKRDFYLTDIGKHFREQPHRYSSRYKVSKNITRQYIGPDASPIGHQVTLSNHYIPIVVQHEVGYPLSPSDMALLRFVSDFHDIGESTHKSLTENELSPVGDIASGEKTAENKADEAAILNYLLSSYPFNRLDPEFINRAKEIISHKPSPADEHLHRLFEIAHHLQSFDTGIYVRYFVEHGQPVGEENQDDFEKLQRLSENVAPSELQKIYALTGESKLFQIACEKYYQPNHNQLDIEHSGCRPNTIGPQRIGHIATISF